VCSQIIKSLVSPRVLLTRRGTATGQQANSDDRPGRLCVLTSFAGNERVAFWSLLSLVMASKLTTSQHVHLYMTGAGTGLGAKIRQTTVYPDALFQVNNTVLSMKVRFDCAWAIALKCAHLLHLPLRIAARVIFALIFLLAVRSPMGRGHRSMTGASSNRPVLHLQAG
jgi:hypothetical protein